MVGVLDVCQEVLDGALARGAVLRDKADERDHGEAAVEDLGLLVLLW